MAGVSPHEQWKKCLYHNVSFNTLQECEVPRRRDSPSLITTVQGDPCLKVRPMAIFPLYWQQAVRNTVSNSRMRSSNRIWIQSDDVGYLCPWRFSWNVTLARAGVLNSQRYFSRPNHSDNVLVRWIWTIRPREKSGQCLLSHDSVLNFK